MMDLKLRKIVGWFSVFIFLGAFLFVGLAQAAGAPTTISVGGSPSGLVVTPDGKYVYVSNGEDVAVIDTASSKVVARVAVGGWPSSGVAVSPSGEYVYVLNRGNGGYVSVINTVTDTVTSTIMLGSNPMEVVVSSDGQYVYVLTSELLEVSELEMEAFGVISVISTDTYSVLSNITVGRFAIEGLAVSSDGKCLYVTGDGLLYVVDSSLKTETTGIKLGERVGSGAVVVSSDGKYVYVLSGAEVFVVSAKSKSVVATVSGLGYPSGLAVSPDGKYVYVAEAGRNVVSAINTATNVVDFSVDASRSPLGVVVSSDGGCLYVFNSVFGSSDGKVSVVKLDSSVVGSGSSVVGDNSSIVYWLLGVVVCVVVVVVVAFVVVKRMRRRSIGVSLMGSDVENQMLAVSMLFLQGNILFSGV